MKATYTLRTLDEAEMFALGNLIHYPVRIKRKGARTKGELCRDELDLLPHADLLFDEDPATQIEVWHAGDAHE